MLDIETGAAKIGHAAAWVREHEALHTHHEATIYVNLSNLPGVITALRGLTYVLWIANPTGKPHAYQHPAVVATQYAWPGLGSPGHFDLSLVSDDDWHPGPRPPKHP